IFSGGKAEPRKGQDIVVAAFRIFARRHPEAVLVTAWHSHWPELARGMDLDLSAFPGRVIDTGALPNGLMAPIYRECDVALFPNRAEGGTNLVAMECLACGVPTILSDCTGHRDLLRLGLGHKLAQKPSRLWSEWGESDVDEVVEALEWAFCNARPSASCPPQLPQWSEATAALVGLARDIYETASAGSRRGSSEPVNETADFAALFAQAVQHHLQGRFPEAMDLYDRAIQLDAAVAPVHCNRGMALQSLGLADAALQSFDKAIALDPRFAEAHYNRGLVLRQLGRARDAIQSYDHAIGFKPDFAESYYNRGNALRDIKQPEAALESFAKAVDVKPDFADARVASGNTLLELGRHAAAIDCYDQAIRCKPDHAVAWCARGYALQELGRLHEAVDSYDHAIKHDPRFVEAHINRGKALQAAGRYEEALRSCDVAIELTPDSAEAHCHRGDALMNLGRSEAAVESYERAIRLQPLYAEAYSKRAGALAALGRSDAALDSHRTAAALNPALAGVDNSAR
ncbi:MAG TPA: tetratricopeptide repeat protein, partial [Rhizomicrobium sp.]|nr:tetratricopeptide repeat protein [Rhizomicrobium sp.]